MENLDATIHGFSSFRIGTPNYSHKSIFQNRVEIITNGKGRITGVTNPEKLLFAKVPPYADEIQLLEVGPRAFSLCQHLRSISFSENLEYVGEEAFSGCLNLDSVELPSDLYELGGGVFSKSGLKSIVIPKDVTELPSRCFEDCHELRSVTLSSDPKKLGTLCFNGCEKLESLHLGFSLTEIPDGCFMGSGLRSISLPHSIRRIGISSFSRCRQLTSIYYDGTANDFRRIHFSMNWNKGIPANCRLFVKDEKGLWCDVFSNRKEDENANSGEKVKTEMPKASALNKQMEGYLKTLGLDHKPTLVELNGAYRKKARKFHPDVISGLNLDQEFLEFAAKKFRELTEAYEYIKKSL